MIGATNPTTPQARLKSKRYGTGLSCSENVRVVAEKYCDLDKSYVMIAGENTDKKHKGNITTVRDGYDSDS